MSSDWNDPGEARPNWASIGRKLAWITLTVLPALIAYMQVESIHRWACGWSDTANVFADCGVYTKAPVPVAYTPAPIVEAKPRPPPGFENAITLPATYPQEFWRAAIPEELTWMEGEWCLVGFLNGSRVQMKLREGKIERAFAPRETAAAPQPRFEDLKFSQYDAFVSNRSVFHLRDVAGKQDGVFLNVSHSQPDVHWQFRRYVLDDGSIESSEKVGAVDCSRCTVRHGVQNCK